MEPVQRLTIPEVVARKRAPAPKRGGDRPKLLMLTAYDCGQAELVEAAGGVVDLILVGDSAANVVHGHDTTLAITMDEMLSHVRAVARGRKRAVLVADMPFLSYQVTVAEAVRNAGRFLKEGFADAVKLEGGLEVASTVRACVDASIPVMGHVGLTPQSVMKLGGYKVQGKDAAAAEALLDAALALERAGAFALVLECVPSEVAALVTERLSIPTIGIGAGPMTDGQVLVFHDLLGLEVPGARKKAKFVKAYADLGARAIAAIQTFAADVRSGAYPDPEHAYTMDARELAKLRAAVARPGERPEAGGGPEIAPWPPSLPSVGGTGTS